MLGCEGQGETRECGLWEGLLDQGLECGPWRWSLSLQFYSLHCPQHFLSSPCPHPLPGSLAGLGASLFPLERVSQREPGGEGRLQPVSLGHCCQGTLDQD